MSEGLESLLDGGRVADCDRNDVALEGRPYSFNDDDVYVVDARTLKIVRHIGCKSCEYIGSYVHGFRAYPGQMVLKGLQAKFMGVHA